MEPALIGVLFCFASCGLAIWANNRLQGEGRLPMQWWLSGEVTWSAPRPIALAFVPALTILVFAGLTVLSFYTRPRPGQEGMVIPSLITVGFIFLAAQVFHLWMVEKTVRQDRGYPPKLRYTAPRGHSWSLRPPPHLALGKLHLGAEPTTRNPHSRHEMQQIYLR
jgi:hypothetical protein